MSNSNVVIQVEGLGKKYSLHHEKSERYIALRDVVARQAKAAGRLLNPFTMASQLRKAQRQAAQEHACSEEEFWALKDVSFEIHRGERVGIIGLNGAGKSTLLKILSRITEPTTGRVAIRGRVASLLEVGTGFHSELTGRENIYLNGAILGMTRREVRSKFDEIVDFAEVSRFLDTPVKRYSSGMYVRLAFAVAAHLEPEILVVDEVLAVGDASFQKKCLGKMEEVAEREGRTVLFVSHQMGAIQQLCTRGILLKDGSIVDSGPVETIVNTYMYSGVDDGIISLDSLGRKPGHGSAFRFINYKVDYAEDGSHLLHVIARIDPTIKGDLLVSIGFCTLGGELLFNCPSVVPRIDFCDDCSEFTIKLRLELEKNILSEGLYRINFFCEINGQVLDHLPSAGSFSSLPRLSQANNSTLVERRRKGVLIDYKLDAFL